MAQTASQPEPLIADFRMNAPHIKVSVVMPGHIGTGIRVSVMLHLPALKLTGEIEKVFRAAKQVERAVVVLRRDVELALIVMERADVAEQAGLLAR